MKLFHFYTDLARPPIHDAVHVKRFNWQKVRAFASPESFLTKKTKNNAKARDRPLSFLAIALQLCALLYERRAPRRLTHGVETAQKAHLLEGEVDYVRASAK